MKSKKNISLYDYYRKDFKATNVFELDTIKIRNPEKWKVAKLTEFIK